MIKHINHQNFLTTPFVAVKEWELYNGQNNDVVLIEPTDSPEVAVALDYIDYSSDYPVLNRECNIALEQQEADNVIYQEGISGSGFFDPSTEPQNPDGTYKRLVHNQTQKAFYNQYRDPTKMFGMDYIDFPIGQTERQFTEFIRLFNIPQQFFGDRIVPRTLKINDTSLDDNVEIFDDGYQNIMAGYNLFSKVQEVRTLGNLLFDGTQSNACISYAEVIKSASVADSASLSLVNFNSGYISNYTFTDGAPTGSTPISGTTIPSGSFSGSYPGGSSINTSLTTAFFTASIKNSASVDRPSTRTSFTYGTLQNFSILEPTAILANIGFNTGSLRESIVSQSIFDFGGSISSISFGSGSIFNTIISTAPPGPDSASIVNVSFGSGSVFNVIIYNTGSNDSGSVTKVNFVSGSVFNQVQTASLYPYNDYQIVNQTIGFNSGSIWP